MKYRKKPVLIDAIQWSGSLTEIASLGAFNGEVALVEDAFDGDVPPSLEVKTLEGKMTANVGDWIIVGIKREIYPCKDDIFRATYEVVEDMRPSRSGTGADDFGEVS